ncbi:MAG: homoserine dehydrogenase, partial [Candidatus Nanopelagicaceae bacterium]
MSNVKTVKIGMLGCGVVGGSVARELASNSSDLAARAGAKLELSKIAVRTITKREGISDSLFTTDANSVVTDPEIQLIIEVMGGIEPARELILKAIANGKSVVTANKALLATHGADLYNAAEKTGVDLYYEAAVA